MNHYDKSPPSLFSNPWGFFGATFAWSWVFWGLGILLKISLESAFGFGLLLLGVLGPMATGMGFTYLTKNKAGQRDYWLRIIDLRRIGLKWFLILLLFVPALNGLAALIDVVLGGTGAVWGNTLLSAASNPFGLVLSAIFATLIPFIEELGWRGYVLDRLQATRSDLMATEAWA